MIRLILTTTCLWAALLSTVTSTWAAERHAPSNARRTASRTAAAVSGDGLSFEVSDEFHGIARPSQQADLPALVRGTISVVHVREGQSVNQGDPLITLDDRVPQARLNAATIKANLTGTLQRAEVDLRMAESRVRRLRRVTNSGAGAAFELEESEGLRDRALATVQQQRDLLQAAEAERQMAQAELDQYTIHAPFDGTITELHRKSGTVDPSIPVVSLANLRTLEVEMHLPSQMYGTLQQGDTVRLQAAAPVARVVQTEVLSVSPVLNSASDTFRCLLQADNSSTNYPAGFSVVLHSDARDGQAVKRTATRYPRSYRR